MLSAVILIVNVQNSKKSTRTFFAVECDGVPVRREIPQDELHQLLGALVALLDAVDKTPLVLLHVGGKKQRQNMRALGHDKSLH